MKTHVMLQGSCDGKMQTYCGKFVKKSHTVKLRDQESASCLACLRSRLLQVDTFWAKASFWKPA